MSDNSCCELMNNLISQVEKIDYGVLLATAEERLGIKEFKISQMSPTQAYEIYHSVYIKFKKNPAYCTELNWWENQLRIFIWILVCYMELRKLKIEDLNSPDWEFFARLFPNKQHILFEYQALSLLRETATAKKWTQQEDELFSQLIQGRDQKYKWSEFAKELYIRSGRKFFRTPKQCRERWLNHLDPNKSKQEWELKEDYVLISHVRTKGKKWADISKMLKDKRNQHSIKNRYKSLLTKQQKLHTEKLEEEALVEQIFRKYENHFAKMSQTSSAIRETEQQISSQEQIPTGTSIPQSYQQKQAFQFVQSATKTTSKQQNAQILPSSNSANSIEQAIYSQPPEPFICQLPSNTIVDPAQREEFEKQIRADMLICFDPFDFLKRFYRSKDWMQIRGE